MGATAAAGQSACILPPQAIDLQAKQKVEEEKKLKSAFDSGEIADLSTLTVKQLQTLAKQNGIAVARTKSDFIKLLDKAEPSVHHGDLSGTALQAKIKEYNIAALRSKDELVNLLAEKQAAIKQTKALEEAVKSAAPQTGLSDLTMVQLKDMAKQQGISLNLTKSEVIEMLDSLEPGTDHSGLAGKALIAAKQKHGIPPLKNKEQLVKALEKSAGQQMAEQIKQQAFDAAKQEVLKKAEQALKDATSQIVMPSTPAQYEGFLDSVKAAESELEKKPNLSASVLEEHAKEIALKKLTFKQQVSTMKSGELKDLAKQTKVKHWQWASKDELVTLFTETDTGKISAAKSGIEAKHAEWAKKHLAKPVKAPQPAAKTTGPKLQPNSQPITSAPSNTFSKKGSEFDAVDAVWSEKGKPERFKLVGKAQIGGAHEKEFWIDEKGEKWLFKPVGESSDDFIAYGEEAAYKIGRLIDPEAIEVRTIQLNGRLGSIQKWKTGLAQEHDFSAIDIVNLAPEEIEQIQREHVIDWLISNHDGHSKQFLRAKSGRVYGIDKGQLFKFLDSDKLSIDYHPNAAYGESEPFYNTVYRAVKQGKLAFDPSVTLRYIREVEKISDDDYLALIRPYVEGRFADDDLKKKAFYDLALARKHNLKRDFQEFYSDVLGKKGFAFEDVIEAPTKSRIGKAEEEIIEEARILGWQGKIIPIDDADIEDQNVLLFTESVSGKERTIIKFKVRPQAEQNMIEKLDLATGKDVDLGERLPEDVFDYDILAAVKTVNHHAQDHNYNQEKLNKLTIHFFALQKLEKSEDPDVRKMAHDYLEWIKRIQDAARGNRSIPERFETYRKNRESSDMKKTPGFSAKKTNGRVIQRKLSKGEIETTDESIDYTTAFGNRPISNGEQYDINFGDGIRATYKPWSEENDCLYTQSGEFEMILPGRPHAKSIDTALEHIERLGLKANVATSEDAEFLYLQKAAYVSKVDIKGDYFAMMLQLDMRNATRAERIQAMRGYWEKRLGVPDITKLSGYDPAGTYQLGFKDRNRSGGYRHQYRFDISDDQIEEDMKGYALFHSVTSNSSVSSFLDMVFENNGALVSTVEKLRAGIPPGGLSPESDMRTGGATYVFTRIAKSPIDGIERRKVFISKRDFSDEWTQ